MTSCTTSSGSMGPSDRSESKCSTGSSLTPTSCAHVKFLCFTPSPSCWLEPAFCVLMSQYGLHANRLFLRPACVVISAGKELSSQTDATVTLMRVLCCAADAARVFNCVVTRRVSLDFPRACSFLGLFLPLVYAACTRVFMLVKDGRQS